ncbi:MAG: hypothetical protein RBT02_09105 [Bacteroidales bacterium]|nr:hypothetical protein [Bacteroidales bacterium]
MIEIIWIILGLICMGIAIREIAMNGMRHAWLFIVMSAAAFLLARVRDSQRKKL